MGRVIQGYCLRPHKETHGASRIDKEWTEDALREAAETLVGRPVTSEGAAGASDPSTIGEVVYAEYVEGKGVRYEAEIHDEASIEKIERGLAEPAPRMYHEMPDDYEEPVEIDEFEFDALFLTPQPTDAVPHLGPPGTEPTERFK